MDIPESSICYTGALLESVIRPGREVQLFPPCGWVFLGREVWEGLREGHFGFVALRQLGGSQEKEARVRKMPACGLLDGQHGVLLGSSGPFRANQGIDAKVLLLW